MPLQIESCLSSESGRNVQKSFTLDTRHVGGWVVFSYCFEYGWNSWRTVTTSLPHNASFHSHPSYSILMKHQGPQHVFRWETPCTAPVISHEFSKKLWQPHLLRKVESKEKSAWRKRCAFVFAIYTYCITTHPFFIPAKASTLTGPLKRRLGASVIVTG